METRGGINKSVKLLTNIILIALICLAAYLLLPRLLVVFMPFLLAYLLAAMIEPLVRLLHEKLRLGRHLASVLCVVLTILVLGALLFWLGHGIVGEIKNLTTNWPQIYARSEAQLSMIGERFSNFFYSLSPDVQGFLESGYNAVKSELSSVLKPVADAAISLTTSAASKLPSALIFSVVMFLAAYFISSDRSRVSGIAGRLVGTRVMERVSKIVGDLKRALGGYVKAQLIIMSIVFAILLVGLLIAQVPYAVLIALCVAVFDALPVFGSGAVLIPWGIISLLMNDIRTGIIMLVLYGVILVTRQTLEPKIVGQHIGVPPLLTLMAMYGGLKFFGIFGMILGPVLVLVIRNLYRAGLFDDLFRKGQNKTAESAAASGGAAPMPAEQKGEKTDEQ